MLVIHQRQQMSDSSFRVKQAMQKQCRLLISQNNLAFVDAPVLNKLYAIFRLLLLLKETQALKPAELNASLCLADRFHFTLHRYAEQPSRMYRVGSF